MKNEDVKTESQEDLETQQTEKPEEKTEAKPAVDQDLVNEAIQKRLGRQEVKHQKELETVKDEVKEQVTKEVTEKYESKLEQELQELRDLKNSLLEKEKKDTVNNFVKDLKHAGLDDSAIAVLTETVDIDKMADFDPTILTGVKTTSAVALKTKEEGASLNERDENFDPYAIYKK